MNIQKRIYKFLLSMTHIGGGAPSATLEKLMRRDPELRRHWEAEEELTRSLRSGQAPSAPVPSKLRDRILNGLEAEEEGQYLFWPSLTKGWMTSAAAAALLFGFVLIVVQFDNPSNDAEEVAPAPAVEQPTVRPGAPISLQSPIEDHPLVKLSAIVESPLREEPQRLLNDAESALRFLSATFVPSKSLRHEVVSSLIGDKPVEPDDSEA